MYLVDDTGGRRLEECTSRGVIDLGDGEEAYICQHCGRTYQSLHPMEDGLYTCTDCSGGDQ
jgi:predicted SprT family Zn-dependent metalloprotease